MTTTSLLAQSPISGVLIAVAHNNSVDGCIKANGALLSRGTYTRLFNAIGETYGAGDGVTTFAVPDMRGLFARGLDNGAGIDSGRALGVEQADDFQAHTHPIQAAQSFTASSGTGYSVYTQYQNTGSYGGTETRPKNEAVVFHIVY